MGGFLKKYRHLYKSGYYTQMISYLNVYPFVGKE
jgi:hypothetical protein